jgi:predicted NUDIX family phosphoesterase
MSKQALCIHRSNFDKLVSVSEVIKKTDTLTMVKLNEAKTLFDIPSFLEGRDTCEKDTTKIHFIPYVSLIHVDENAEPHIYTYVRGKGGGEDRLHDNCSVGFGGHVEEAPSQEKNLKRVLVECIIRELEEEVGMKLSDYKAELALNNARVFLDTSNDVGKVHLALAVTINVRPKDIGELEVNVIESLKLEKVSDVIKDIQAGKEATGREFESWSKIVLGL